VNRSRRYLTDAGTDSALHDSADDCTACLQGTYTAAAATATCTACPAGTIPFADRRGCKALLKCENNEYLSDETCVTCNNNMSILLVILSFLSFVAITYYMKDKVTNKATMIQVKCLVTFFQVAQLTTLVDIAWPKIALMMPFTVPYGDANCLTNQLHWNQQYSFFAYIYGALFIMYALRKRTRKHFAGSLGRRKGYQQLVFLVLLWYSPLVQNAASMYRCQYDPEDGWVLVADPRVSCEESFLRGTTRVHAIAVMAVVGAGLPFVVLRLTLQIRSRNELTADSIYAGLFEWFSPKRPYWEAVLLFKKFL